MGKIFNRTEYQREIGQHKLYRFPDESIQLPNGKTIVFAHEHRSIALADKPERVVRDYVIVKGYQQERLAPLRPVTLPIPSQEMDAVTHELIEYLEVRRISDEEINDGLPANIEFMTRSGGLVGIATS